MVAGKQTWSLQAWQSESAFYTRQGPVMHSIVNIDGSALMGGMRLQCVVVRNLHSAALQ